MPMSQIKRSQTAIILLLSYCHPQFYQLTPHLQTTITIYQVKLTIDEIAPTF
jgi:hypothetical protein